MAAALHINARSGRDIERWIAFVAQRPEITHLAYEFTTGAGRAERSAVHAGWLAKLARQVGRPMTLIVRGGVEILPILTEAYASVAVVETSAFMKAMKRQRAVVSGNAGLRWEHVPTAANADLDDLVEHNVRLATDNIRLSNACRAGTHKAVAA